MIDFKDLKEYLNSIKEHFTAADDKDEILNDI